MKTKRSRQNRCLSATLALLAGTALGLAAPTVRADEGGMGVWLPGMYGSLAATPAAPGWSLGAIYYRTSVDASATRQFPIGGGFTAGLDAQLDLLMLVPTYVFADPVLGGQAALSVAGIYGHSEVSGTLTGPRGRTLLSGDDSLTAFGDLFPSASLRWNDGKHNYLAYGMLGVPVGSYRTGRLANLGSNHWSIDAGGGYTYFNRTSGREFSVVAGLTWNFENPDTDYRNGVDAHMDWGASQFLSPCWHVGLVGYFYDQLSGDSGAGARFGDFKSRVAGIGPQLGYLFALGNKQAYVNLKGYHEFGANHRPDGWNVWLTLSLPL